MKPLEVSVIVFTPMKRKSLFFTLFVSFIPLIFIGLTSMVFLINSSVKEFYFKEKEKELSSIISLLSFSLKSSRYNEIQGIRKITLEASNLTNVRVTIVDSTGLVLADSKSNPLTMDNHINRPEIISALKTSFGRSIRYSKTLNQDFMYVAKKVPYNQKSLIIRCSIELSLINQIIFSAQINILYFSVFIGVLLFLFSYFLSKRISRPLENMKQVASDYMKNYKLNKIDLPKTYTKEMATLARSFNFMAKEINSKINDLTKQKEERDALLSSLQEGLIVLDREKNILSINNVAKNYFNFLSDELIGTKITNLKQGYKINRFINKALKSQTEITQKEIKIKTNKNRFFLFTVSSLVTGNTKTGHVISINDITLIKQLEKLRQDFVSNVSHELKTPITSIIGFMDILNDGEVSKVKEKEFIIKVLNQSNRMNNIIDDLLKLSKIESQEEDETIKLVKQPLISALEGAADDLRYLANKNGNNINIICKSDLEIKIDSTLFREALNNLLHNAIKYGEPNSLISVSVLEKNNIKIFIENTGSIVPEKYKERIFQRFFRVDKSRSRSRGGTGLGLAIVKHIVLVHNGTIVYSNHSKNLNRFTISLPI